MDKKLLIKKFLANKATADEAAEAMHYLKEHPSILDEILPEAEWQSVEQLPIPTELDEAIREKVLKKTKPAQYIRMFQWTAVAAATLFIVAKLFLPGPQITPALQPVQLAKSTAPAKLFDTLFNNSSTQKTIVLKDGSRVKLFAQAVLIVPSNMKEGREINLSGKAIFYVAKNPDVPFIVKSGAISTTALGTIFMVDATMQESSIHIALYEGKVVVKPLDKKLNIQPAFLKPRQQCEVDILAGTVTIEALPLITVAPSIQQTANSPLIDSNNLSLLFEKVPLQETFSRLERRFNKTISYDKAKLKASLFTGNFDEQDSLNQILKVIGTMNGLVVLETPTGYELQNKTTVTTKSISESSLTIKELLPAFDSTMLTAPTAIATVEPAAPAGIISRVQDGYLYQKVALSKVFEQLQQEHKIRIQFNKEAIQELFFTGTIPDDHSYANMLQVLCRMNGLKLHKIKRGNYSVELPH